MKTLLKVIVPFSLMLLVSYALIGCSGSHSTPTAPAGSPPACDTDSTPESNHALWGIWSISVDPATLTASIEPVRNPQIHVNITDFILPPACNDCLKVVVNSLNPVTHILDLDITLRNPYPISGYDVRGILFTNSAGHALRNADAWTKLWDAPGGGTINPFIAFAREEPNRIFTGGAEHTENFQVYIPTPPQFNLITFAVDASWPNNCNEPYAIDNFIQHDVLYAMHNETATLRVEVRDWQDDITKVTLVAPEITGESFTQFHHIYGPLWGLEIENHVAEGAAEFEVRLIASSANSGSTALYDYVTITVTGAPTPSISAVEPVNGLAGTDILGFTITGSNFQGPDAQVKLTKPGSIEIIGENVMVETPNLISCDLSIPLLAKAGLFDIEITNGCGKSVTADDLFEVLTHEPDNIVDVTPAYLNFNPEDIAYADGYAYIAGGIFGLHIFDVSNPAKPTWVDSHPTDYNTVGVDVAGGYVYVADSGQGLLIFDATLPGSLTLINTFTEAGTAKCVVVDGAYAYVGNGEYELKIIDIDPPGSASVTKTVNISGDPHAMVYDTGFVYITTKFPAFDMDIVDVDPPATAEIAKTVAVNGNGLDVVDGYAYIACGTGSKDFKIFDVDPPGAASLLLETNTMGTSYDVVVSGGYAYVACSWGGMSIVDVSPIGTGVVVNIVPVPNAKDLVLADGMAYIGDGNSGLFVIDINYTSSACITGAVNSPADTESIDVVGDKLYCEIEYGGFLIYDISQPSLPVFINRVKAVGDGLAPETELLTADNGHAYMSNSSYDLVIVDIDPPESAYPLLTVPIGEEIFDVFCLDGYVYVADYYGLNIIDVDPVGSANIVKYVNTPEEAFSVYVEGDYAYVGGYDESLHIIDLSPPESAYILNSVPLNYEGYDISVDDGYAYVAVGSNGLDIIDIDPPGSESFVKNISGYTTTRAKKMGNHVFSTVEFDGMWVIDVTDPATAATYTIFDTPGYAMDIAIVAGYAYIADRNGIRILKLW